MSFHLLLSGLPGRMAAEVYTAFLENPIDGMELLPVGLSGEPGQFEKLELIGPDSREQREYPNETVAIDFSQPDAAIPNIRFFAKQGIPFVMGTTGFDREESASLVRSSQISAVIAPNMAVPIILIQAAVAEIARRYPGALDGYRFSLKESHQAGKKDTSGTAKALAADFAKLGLPASEERIRKVRDAETQRAEFSVPEEHIAGHAYHFYDIQSPEASVDVGLSHCVRGRRVYADGALMALKFLLKQTQQGAKGEVYSMEEVLQG